MSPERLKMTPSLAQCFTTAITMALICVNKECVNQKKKHVECACACNDVKRRASLYQQTQGRVI